MRNDKQLRRGRFFPRLALLTGVLVLPLTACDTEALLEVNDPDIITPGSLTGPTGLNAFFAGAIGDFSVAHVGGAGSGSFRDGYVTTAAYFTDEAYLAGTFPTRTEFDQRDVDDNNGTLENVFSRLQRARRSLEVTADLLADADAADPRIAEVLGLASVIFNDIGEGFCSGVPFSSAPLGGEVEFGGPQTTVQIFERAIERADRAIGVTGATEDGEFLARTQKGRALLNLGRFQEAAQAVASVPTSFLYVTTHTVAASRSENGLAAANIRSKRLGISNDEGGPGTPFAVAFGEPSVIGNGLEFVAAEDPRIPVVAVEGAFDNTVPVTLTLLGWPQYGIDLDRAGPFPVASGIEARLIEAEAALQTDPAAALAILNELRAETDIGLEPLTGPLTVEDFFRERAFWLFAQGRRLGDLRRLIRQYGFQPNQVFPEGPYFKGGFYGEDVNLPIPQEEVNNPEFSQCLDRNA